MFTKQISKKVINANIPNSKIEGLQVKIFSARLSDEYHQKLGEIMDILGVTGNTESDRFRSLIDKLYETVTQATVTKSASFTMPQPIKQRIKVTQGIMWITCPKDQQAHRINDCHNCNDPKFSNCKEAVKKYMEA